METGCLKFFFDTSISHRIPAAINALKEDIETPQSKSEILHLREKFKSNVDDYDWLNTLVLEGGWVVVSADPRITRNELQKKIWREKNIVLFVLEKGWRGQKLWDRAWRLVRVWPDILKTAKKAKPGSAYKISVHCKIAKLT